MRLLAVGAVVPRRGVAAILCAAGEARLGGPTERGPTLGGPTLPGPVLDLGASRLKCRLVINVAQSVNRVINHQSIFILID